MEGRLAPAVQLLYGGPGTVLQLTETATGATPTVTVSEPSANLLTIDLGAGHTFDPSSTATATGLTYSDGTPGASRSVTVSLGRADNVRTLRADLAGDALALGPITDALGGLGNVTASAGTIRVNGLDTSAASVGNGNVNLRAAGDLTVGSPVLPYGAVLDTGTGTLLLAADVNADGSGDDGSGTLTVQPGSVVVSDDVSSGAITLRGGAAHLGTSAGPALVGARRVLSNATDSFVTAGLINPWGVAFDASGNLYIANANGNSVSRVMAGSSTADPFITTGLIHPNGLAFDARGNLYIANANGNTVSRVAAGNNRAEPFVTSGLNEPIGLAFDANGNLYIANASGNTVSRVAAGSNSADPFVTAGLSRPNGLAFDAAGNLYVSNGVVNGTVSRIAVGGNTAVPFVTALNNPDGLAFDASGNLCISIWNVNLVFKVSANELAPVTGGVAVCSSLPERPLLLGDTSTPVDGINLSSVELTYIRTTTSGTLTFGDPTQTGDITFRTARPATTAGAAVVVSQNPAGPGRVVLDDAGIGIALDGTGGSVTLTVGTGGIVSAHPAAGLFEIATTDTVSLDTGGVAGTAASPLHLAAPTLAAQAAGGLTLVTQAGQLAADGGTGGASVRNGGDLAVTSVSSLTGLTAAGPVSVRTTGDLLVAANVTSTGAGNVLLQADGSLTIDPAATVQAAGVIRLLAGFGALSTNSVLTVGGASLLAPAAILDLGIDSTVTVRLVPGGSTPVILDGGGNGLLDLNDGADPATRTWTVTDSMVGWGGPSLTFAGIAALTIEGGSGGNTFNLATTPAGPLVSLTGGTGGDTFRFAERASVGGIAGGGAATLDYSGYTTSVVVDLQTGAASGVGGLVSGILSVIGGSGTPVSAGVYNLLIGSGGNTLTGGTGRRNVLVAGGTAGTLVAGDGDDLLIGGSTAYDTEPGLPTWLQLAAYWAGSDDYTTRAANLTSGTGVPLLDATVVTGNGGGNVLVGRGPLGLIYTNGLDTITGFDPNSQQVAISP